MIVLFGGSFNPPTIAHYEIAKHILNVLPCHHFYYLPVGNQYPKKGLIDGKHRVEMLKLICENLPGANVSTIEIDANRVLTSFETLNKFKAQHQEADIAFVMGADNLKDLHKWAQAEELMANYKLIIFKRDDFDVTSIIDQQFAKYKDQFILLESFGKMNVSSSAYRNDKANEHLVLPIVSDYIHHHQLYGRMD